MPYNLSTPSGNPGDPRPHQTGKATGYKHGSGVNLSIDWMIDTGAQISVVTKSTGAQFTLTNVGGSASATTGGGGILVKSGLTTAFEIFDSAGAVKAVTSSLDIGVKLNNHGSEIIGMDRARDVGALVEWDPGTGAGRLREP